MLISNAGITGSGQVSPADALDQAPSTVDLGFVDTDINDHTGYVTTAQGAAVVVRLATLDTDGPTGGFFSEGGPLPW